MSQITQTEITLHEVNSEAVQPGAKPKPKLKPKPDFSSALVVLEISLTVTEIERALNSFPKGVCDHHHLRALCCGDDSLWQVRQEEVTMIYGTTSAAKNGKLIWSSLVSQCPEDRRMLAEVC